jgi:dTDP-4-amino-4,6-dideoxygalactose transaminase
MLIPFEDVFKERYFSLLDEVFKSGFLTEGAMLKRFEDDFSKFIGIPCCAVSSGGAALLSIFEYIGVEGKEVILPANTFWATAVAVKMAGGKVVYADCNREDLCLSIEDVKKKVTMNTKAIAVVHIGGHIAFQIEELTAFCQEKDIYLVEDCAHVHGGTWNGKAGGAWGIAGAYSFYATKTMPTGEGGIVCSHNEDFLNWLKYYRNYGKEVLNGKVSYVIKNGFNFRMNEVTAALGIVQLERLPLIIKWKRALAKKYDNLFERRVQFPSGMLSGYYKYIVFDYDLKYETGRVFAESDFGPEIEGICYSLPNSTWIASHHHCPPIYYGWEHSDKDIDELRDVLIK